MDWPNLFCFDERLSERLWSSLLVAIVVSQLILMGYSSKLQQVDNVTENNKLTKDNFLFI